MKKGLKSWIGYKIVASVMPHGYLNIIMVTKCKMLNIAVGLLVFSVLFTK